MAQGVLRVLAGRQALRDARVRHGGHHRAVLAGVDGVDLERRVGAVALVVLRARAGVGRARADGAPAARRRAGAAPRSRARPGPAAATPARSSSRRRPSGPGTTADEHRVQGVQGVERAAAVDAGVQVALGGAHLQVRHDEPAQPDGDRRRVLVDHPGVEDDRAVRAALVGAHPVRHGLAAGLLLALHEHAHVDRQRARRRLRARDVQQRQEVALVVGRAARVDRARRARRARTAASSTPPGRRRTARRSGRR